MSVRLASSPRPAFAETPGRDKENHRRLLEAVAQGDETAFSDLYEATLDKVYGVALRITGSPDAAEEVVSEVYLQVWCKAERYDAARSKVLTWLLMITRSRALDHLDQQDRALLSPEPDTLIGDGHQGSDQMDDWLAGLERESAIHAALRQLQPVQRQLIGLAFFKGFSHRQIADFTGMPLGSIKTYIRTAVEALRHTLHGKI